METEHDFSNARRGPVIQPPANKERITIRLDHEILDWFRDKVESQGGGNYQTMINDALRTYIGQDETRLEETLRRVLREELRGV